MSNEQNTTTTLNFTTPIDEPSASPEPGEGLTIWLTSNATGSSPARAGLVRNADGTTSVAIEARAGFNPGWSGEFAMLIMALERVAKLGHSLSAVSPRAIDEKEKESAPRVELVGGACHLTREDIVSAVTEALQSVTVRTETTSNNYTINTNSSPESITEPALDTLRKVGLIDTAARIRRDFNIPPAATAEEAPPTAHNTEIALDGSPDIAVGLHSAAGINRVSIRLKDRTAFVHADTAIALANQLKRTARALHQGWVAATPNATPPEGNAQ